LAKVPPSGRDYAQDKLTDASGDARATEELLRGSVMDGGLWFADASCAPFATPGPIKPEQFHDFARCLAGLHLQVTDRRDPLPDVAVMTYAPGIEIEARIVGDRDGPRLTWIGFESRRDDADSLPTISPALLESLRLDSEPKPGIADSTAYAWLKVCLAADGSLASITPFEVSSPQAGPQFGSLVASWRFKPSPIGAACSMVRLGSTPPRIVLPFPPPAGTDAPVMIALTRLHRTAGDKNIVPDDRTKIAIGRAGLRRLVGSFKMCIDTRGRVAVVVPLQPTGVESYDQKILRTIKTTWVFEPVLDGNQPVPVCSGVTFIYSQD
jgi:hypothetical protein